MDDTQLLIEYVKSGSEAAFAELVRRHIDMVYAAARRQVRNADLAQDVMQAVFIVLARKAAKVRSGGVLPAWLLSCTRYAAANALSAERRRRLHETKAAEMTSNVTSGECAAADALIEQDDPIAATLDQAMARLGEADRSAVAMRYLQDKTFVEVAAAMQTTEEAARKRVERAVQKLRDYFVQRGVSLAGTEFDAGLSRQMRQVAPAALAQTVAAKALSAKSLGAIGAAGSCGAIAGGVIRALTWTAPVKITVAACATVVVLAGAGAVAVQSKHVKPPVVAAAPASGAPVILAAATAPATFPSVMTFDAKSMWMPYVPSMTPGTDVVAIANDSLTNKRVIDGYTIGLDPAMKRTTVPAAMISGSAATSASAGPQAGGRDPLHQSIKQLFDPAPYRGKRVRLSGYVKSKEIDRAAGLALWVYGANDGLLAMDDMGGRFIFGTHDWAWVDIVSDVPAETTQLVATAYLKGPGTIWADGLEMAVVGNDVPVTDNHRWRPWTTSPSAYHVTLDHNELHEGRPTICVRSVDDVGGEWITYDYAAPDVRPFLGKKLKLTAMLKGEDVERSAGPLIRAVGPNNTTLKMDIFHNHQPIVGSPGWATYTTWIDFPKDAAAMSFGVGMSGKGAVWIDSLRFEVVDHKSE